MGNTQPIAVHPDVYDAEWVEEMGGMGSNNVFVQSQGQNIRPRLAYALKLGDVQPGMSVLDIGCGRGEVMLKCRSRGAASVIGIDYATVPLRVAHDNLEAMGLHVNSDRSTIGLDRADVKALPFADEAFDRIFMLDVVEHLYEWELQMVWREVQRLLKPDGLLIIHTLPNRWAMDYGYRMINSVIPGLPTTVADKRDIFHVNEQSVISMARSLRRGGLQAKVWLTDQMLAQADWLRETQLKGEEAQMQIYATLQKPLWRKLYRLATNLSTRVLLVTDLFAIAWKSEGTPSTLQQTPRAYTERLLGYLGR